MPALLGGALCSLSHGLVSVAVLISPGAEKPPVGPIAGHSHPVRCPCRACLCAYNPRRMSPERSGDKQERSTSGWAAAHQLLEALEEEMGSRQQHEEHAGAICRPLEPWKPREGTLFCRCSHCPCFLSTLPSSFLRSLLPQVSHSFVSPVSDVCWENSSQMVTVSFYHMGPRDRTLMSSSEVSAFPSRAILLAPVGDYLSCFGGKKSEIKQQIEIPNKG